MNIMFIVYLLSSKSSHRYYVGYTKDLKDNPEFANVEIYDIIGRKILDHKVFENRQISVSNLSKGLYIYQLHYKGITHKVKIVFE